MMRMMDAELEREKQGSSRFQVLYSQPRGSKKQRQWRDGSLIVGFLTATLYDNEEHRTVFSQRGSGLMPNKVFQKMKDAHGGADWTPRRTGAATTPCVLTGLSGCGTGSSPVDLVEVWFGPGYLVQILEVLELHLVTYGCGGGGAVVAASGPTAAVVAPTAAALDATRTQQQQQQQLPLPLPLPPPAEGKRRVQLLSFAAVDNANGNSNGTGAGPPPSRYYVTYSGRTGNTGGGGGGGFAAQAPPPPPEQTWAAGQPHPPGYYGNLAATNRLGGDPSNRNFTINNDSISNNAMPYSWGDDSGGGGDEVAAPKRQRIAAAAGGNNDRTDNGGEDSDHCRRMARHETSDCSGFTIPPSLPAPSSVPEGASPGDGPRPPPRQRRGRDSLLSELKKTYGHLL